MDAAVIAIGFGEPPRPDRDLVETYLERIFFANMAIEGEMPEPAARERAQELASERAPGLMSEYEAIGGSPLMDHLEGHRQRLETELEDRGLEVEAFLGTQFFDPTIEDAVADAATRSADTVIGLPVYPLCGPSTTVAALETFTAAVTDQPGWEPTVHTIGGWHRHPRYNRLRAAKTRATAGEHGYSVTDPNVELVFSAHGTPISYLEEGSRYDRYVDEYCEAQAALLGAETYTLGFQNHESRGVEWTEPDIETAIEGVTADTIVVDPVSFVHEQSETLAELDDDLAAEAAELGLEFIRVPVPHDEPGIGGVLADLVEPYVAGFAGEYYGHRPCQCATTDGTRCLCAPQ